MSDDNDQLLENIIMKFLYTDVVVRDKIIPYLNHSLFDVSENIEIVKFIKKFMSRYDKFPNVSETKLKFKNVEAFDHLKNVLKIDTSEYTEEIILSEIQLYIMQKSIMDVCFSVAEKVSNDGDISEIMSAPEEMRNALAFSFDNSVGLDIYSEDAEDKMYDHIHNVDHVISTGLETIDEIIDGGLHEKTLTLIMAPTNMGKSLMMGALAKNNAFNGKKVLYVTCEMSEFKIGERIIANSFDLSIKDIKKLTRDKFSECFKRARESMSGRFIVKEYPTGIATVNHIKNLVKELELKQKFSPDIIYIDYIGIIATNNKNKSDNPYTVQKKITEEVRGLAGELGIPIVSAIQTNRLGMNADELDFSHASDSIGTAFTADIMIGVTQPDELKVSSKYRWVIIKNRYGQKDIAINIKVDYNKMRLSDDDVIFGKDKIVDLSNDVVESKPKSDNEKSEKPKNRNIIRKSDPKQTKKPSNIKY